MIPNEEFREKLADYAHWAWTGWMIYMFSKSIMNNDGSVTIPSSFAERWSRQMNTPYNMLPEHEKGSDREQADYILEIIKSRDE